MSSRSLADIIADASNVVELRPTVRGHDVTVDRWLCAGAGGRWSVYCYGCDAWLADCVDRPEATGAAETHVAEEGGRIFFHA